jgi:hypothetical protein
VVSEINSNHRAFQRPCVTASAAASFGNDVETPFIRLGFSNHALKDVAKGLTIALNSYTFRLFILRHSKAVLPINRFISAF